MMTKTIARVYLAVLAIGVAGLVIYSMGTTVADPGGHIVIHGIGVTGGGDFATAIVTGLFTLTWWAFDIAFSGKPKPPSDKPEGSDE